MLTDMWLTRRQGSIVRLNVMVYFYDLAPAATSQNPEHISKISVPSVDVYSRAHQLRMYYLALE